MKAKTKTFVIPLSLVISCLPTFAIAGNPEDAVWKACESGEKPESRRCVQACQRAQGLKVLAGFSHAMRGTCEFALRKLEAKAFSGRSACGPRSCIYKLTKTKRGGGLYSYAGLGYSVTVKDGIHDYYDISIRDPRGRETIYGMCGNCGINEGSYVSGPLKSLKMSIVGDQFILTAPR